jgi:hypothetical protein
MSEAGLSAEEVGKEIAEHLHKHGQHDDARSRRITIVEAILLATVALLAAWSGYAAAKWSTESRLSLSRATAARTEASELDLAAMEDRTFDGLTFNAWFTAFMNEDEADQALAERRFRDEFVPAFEAWIATDPLNNPEAPKGPTYMDEYVEPEKEQAAEKRAAADEAYAEGAEAGTTADDYVRITVLLASVLFLVGISGHFRIHGARVGLITVSVLILVYAGYLLIVAPKPA